MTNFGVNNARLSGNVCAVFISFENFLKKDYSAQLTCESPGHPIAKSSNWIPVLGHPLDRVPITYQIGRLQLTASPPCWMIITKRVAISFIVLVIQHGRHSPCYLNPWGMAANQL